MTNHRRPYYARRGWQDRFAPLLYVLRVIGTLLLFVGLLACVFVAIWLGAPEGAGFPS